MPKWPTVTSQFKSSTSCIIRTRQILFHMGISTICDYSRHFSVQTPDAQTERSVRVFAKSRTEIWIEKSFYSSDAKSGLDVKMGQYDAQTVGDGYSDLHLSVHLLCNERALVLILHKR
jgi:hypothetical protein